jgi:hypothetical protein
VAPRRALRAFQLDSINAPGAEDAAGWLGERVAGRVHCGASVRSVVRAVNRALSAPYRFHPAARRVRRAAYLAALREHADNAGLCAAVNAGRPGAINAARDAARARVSQELARYGRRGA